MIFQGCINVFSHLPWPVNDTGISLLPDRYQAATWTNADLVPIGPFEQSQATCTFPSNKSKVFSTCMWHCLLPLPSRCELLRIHWPLLLHCSRYNSPIVHVSGNYDEQFVYKNSPWLNTLVLGQNRSRWWPDSLRMHAQVRILTKSDLLSPSQNPIGHIFSSMTYMSKSFFKQQQFASKSVLKSLS